MDKLSTWDKIKLKMRFEEPDSRADYSYLIGKMATPDIPMSILKDVYEGGKAAYKGYTSDEPESLSSLFEKALKTRLQHRNVPQRGIAFSPTGVDMFDLWNPPLQVPEYSAMPDLWSNKKAQ